MVKTRASGRPDQIQIQSRINPRDKAEHKTLSGEGPFDIRVCRTKAS